MPDELTQDEKRARLRLARSEGIGPLGFAQLIDRYGSGRAALRALPDLRGGAIRRIASEAEVQADEEAVDAFGAILLVRGEPDYPMLLDSAPDAPPVLAVSGAAGLLARPAVAIVGARNASGNGCAFARTLGTDLAAAGLVIVSGLARGIDTAAHEGALRADGATAAVIATGLDIAYPPENADLMARIAACGAVVSERPLGAIARAKDFPRRNRIIAGLALGIVVVEAAPSSGSLITARLAADYGREVLAVPGSPQDARHRGTNQLLREGAHLVESAADVLQVLEPLIARAAPPPPRPAARPRRAAAAAPRPAAPPAAAGDLAEILARLLGPTPLAVDELIRECDAAAPDIQAALLDLELSGRVERHPGNRVALRAG